MQDMTPMTDLPYDRTKENLDKEKGVVRRRQDSSNMSPEHLIEGHSVNPNYRVSTSSSSPTTLESPSSRIALNVSGDVKILTIVSRVESSFTIFFISKSCDLLIKKLYLVGI